MQSLEDFNLRVKTDRKYMTRCSPYTILEGFKFLQSVPNIEALRELDLPKKDQEIRVDVRGYYTDSDGGQGAFYYDATSSEPDDGGLIIAPAGGRKGRWKREFSPGLTRAAWWGVQPGIDDDQAPLIQHALRRTFEACGGGTCWLDAGVFRVFATINNWPDNTNLYGEGKGVTILQQQHNIPQNQARSVIDFGDPAYPTTPQNPKPVRKRMVVGQIGFDLFNNPGARAIRLRFASDDVLLIDCRCWLSDVEAGNPRTPGGDRWFCDQSVSGAVTPQTLPGAAGIYNLKLIRCGVSYGVQLTSNAGRGVSGLMVHDCDIEDPVAYGLAITSVTSMADFTIENIQITNNRFKNVGSAILLGRDQTGQGNVIQIYPVIHQMRNVVIADNIIVIGGVYYLGFAASVSVSTYQSYCRNIKIVNNQISTADGVPPSELKAIQVVSYDYNWLSDLMGGVAPTIVGVNTVLNTITTSKPARLYSEMSVQFERTNVADVLPAPLVENRRYRILNENPIFNTPSTPDTNVTYKLLDMSSGTVIPLTSAGSGAIKIIYSPCVENFDIRGNTINGVSEALYLANGFRGTIADNVLRRGNVRSTPSGLLEEVKFLEGNVMNRGSYIFEGRVSGGLMSGQNYDIRDTELATFNVAAVNFSPTQAFATQSWEVINNRIQMVRTDGTTAYRLTTAFRTSGLGRVRINSLRTNGVTSTIANIIDQVTPAMIQGIAPDNYRIHEEDGAFTVIPQAYLTRILADMEVDNPLRTAQSFISVTGKSVYEYAVVLEGRNGGTGSAQGGSRLTGVTFGGEGRGVNWRYRPGFRTDPAGLWALASSATAGHSAHALYAFEQNGVLTVRQIGATAGTLNVVTGAVTGGDYRQLTTNISGRRGFATHVLMSINRDGTAVLYVEGIPVAVVETTSGTAPAWNDSLIPVNPFLNFGYVDNTGGSGTSFPSFEGVFHSIDILNYAPSDAQANQLYSGGVAAVPGYGLFAPTENITNGSFVDGTNWNPSAGVTISGGACNFLLVASGVGVSQTNRQYLKGRAYRLSMTFVSYTGGQLYVGIGNGIFRPAWTPAVSASPSVYEGLIPVSDNNFTIRAQVANTTLSFDDVSMIPIGAVASYVFDSGAGYQIEDGNELKNHMLMETVGWSHLRPSVSARWTGKITADGFFLRNTATLETGHYFTRIMAYSPGGATFTLGEQLLTPANIVASVAIPAATWTDLTLLKRSSVSRGIYGDITAGSEVQIAVFYNVTSRLQS